MLKHIICNVRTKGTGDLHVYHIHPSTLFYDPLAWLFIPLPCVILHVSFCRISVFIALFFISLYLQTNLGRFTSDTALNIFSILLTLITIHELAGVDATAFLPSALNVKLNKFNQTRANGETSNY